MRTKSFAVPALGLSFVAMSLLSGCTKGGGDAIVGPSDPRPPEVKVAVAPQAVTLEVGRTTQLVAVVAGVPAGASTGVRWQSSDAGVAGVDAAGTVTCRAAGSVGISAVAEAAATASDRAAVTCTAAPRPDPQPTPDPHPTPAPTPVPTPPPPASLIGVDKTALSFQYSVGSPNCPVPVGDFAVMNRSQVRVKVEMRAGNDSIELTPSAWELQPGQAAPHPVNVRFNCTANSSFTTNITITASGGGTTETKRIEVKGTIQ